MTTARHQAYLTIATVLGTELNTLAINAYTAASAAQGADAPGTPQPLFGDFELKVTFGSAPTVNTACDLFIVRAVDGTSYSDGSASVIPAPTTYVGSFSGIRAVTTAQILGLYDVPLPPGLWKAILLNNATGQAFPASGSTLKVRGHSIDNS